MEKYTISPNTIARLILLVLSFLNLALEITGHSIVPIDNEAVTMAVSLIWAIIESFWNAWKNNSITQEALAGDELMHTLKEEKKNANSK